MPKFDTIYQATKKIVFSIFGLLCWMCFIASTTTIIFIDRLWLEMSEGVQWLFTFSVFGMIGSVSLLGVWIFMEITEPLKKK